MVNDLTGRYFVRRSSNDEEGWIDVCKHYNESTGEEEGMWAGFRILSVSGFGEMGEAVNVYNEQWVNAQEEDFAIAGDSIIRKNTNLVVTFIISNRYVSESQDPIDEQDVFNEAAKWMGVDGDFWIRSEYTGMVAHVVCLDSIKPTTQKLKRNTGIGGRKKNYIIATATLHMLEAPTPYSEVSPSPVNPTYTNDIYIGFSRSTTLTAADIPSLVNMISHTNVQSVYGSYSILAPGNRYLWICTTQAIGLVESGGFEVPMASSYVELTYNNKTIRCYRTYYQFTPHTMSFTINAPNT